MEDKMKKNDIIVIVLVAFLALGIGGYYFATRTESKNAKVVIEVNGQLYKEVNLYEDQKVEIETSNNHKNLLEIKDGYASMVEADCSDQICVHQRAIHYNGETIVCLPHLIMVTVQSDEEYSVDSVAN